MQNILTCAMGIDIHRDIIVACLEKDALDSVPEVETRSFSTVIPEMKKLRDWVVASECHNVACQSVLSGGVVPQVTFAPLWKSGLNAFNSRPQRLMIPFMDGARKMKV